MGSGGAAYVSGEGALEAGEGESIRFENLGDGIAFDKSRFVKRLWQELRLGVELVRHVRSHRPDVAVLSNVQIPTLALFATARKFNRIPWVLWHEDVYAVAVRSFAGDKLSKGFRFVATGFEGRRALELAPVGRHRRHLRRVRPRAPGLGHGRQGHRHPQLGAARGDRAT